MPYHYLIPLKPRLHSLSAKARLDGKNSLYFPRTDSIHLLYLGDQTPLYIPDLGFHAGNGVPQTENPLKVRG
jgi:hypothetical protein